jgi:hypothetical protein
VSPYTQKRDLPVTFASAMLRSMKPVLAYAGVVQAWMVGERSLTLSKYKSGGQAARGSLWNRPRSAKHGKRVARSLESRGGYPSGAGFRVRFPVTGSGIMVRS